LKGIDFNPENELNITFFVSKKKAGVDQLEQQFMSFRIENFNEFVQFVCMQWNHAIDDKQSEKISGTGFV